MPTELYFYQRQNEKEYAMKKSRLDRLNPDKTPKHLRKKMSEQEFFNDYLEGKKQNARLYGEYVEYAENLASKGMAAIIDAIDSSFYPEQFLSRFSDIENEGVRPSAVLIYNICHIPPSEQVSRFSHLLSRKPACIIGDYHSSFIPDDVAIFIMEDSTGDYSLAKEIIQNTDVLGHSKCYVFVSHSHKDIAKVRKVRNLLENHNFEPILFYLRCMDNGNEDTEKLRDLIHKEIDSREWFLYLESANSKSSDWMQDEIEYIKKRENHVIKKICIDSLSEDDLNSSVFDLIDKLSVFISYSHSDVEIAKVFYDEFCNYGLSVFFDQNELKVGQSWSDQIEKGINDASEKGGVVLLLTKDSLHSRWIRYELEKAIASNGRIYPIYLDEDSNIDTDLFPDSLKSIRFIRCQPNTESIHTCVFEIVKDIRSIYQL